MKGAPVRAIQELAGHADIQTTMRYMHLSPAALGDAISLLEDFGQQVGQRKDRGPQKAESPSG
jgi:integrase